MTPPQPHSGQPKRASRGKRVLKIVAGILVVYMLVSYLIIPYLWKRAARRRPQLEGFPRITHTRSDIPGDPLNIGLIGTEAEVNAIMKKAGWHGADPLSIRSSIGIALGSVFKRPYDEAPVSNLYLWGRKQDLAFQQSVNNNPRKRHHVRFWRSDELDFDGRPVWVGSGTYDERVGMSRTTGQITHRIAPDVDTERNHLLKDLRQTGDVEEVYTIEGFHRVREGRNGGGDPWRTDGNLDVAVLAAGR